MRWIQFLLLAYLVLGLQTGVASAMQWHGSGPNLVLLIVVFVAMYAPRDAGLLGAFVLGAMQDLTSQGTMGLYAFSYGLAAMFVAGAARAVHREHPFTHVLLTLAAGLITAVVIAIHSRLRPPGVGFWPLLYTALYSAILAPLVIGLLGRTKRVFHFQRPRTPRLATMGR